MDKKPIKSVRYEPVSVIIISLLIPLLLCLGFSIRKVEAIANLPSGYAQHQQDLMILTLTVNRNNNTVSVKSVQETRGFIPDYNNSLAGDYLPVTVSLKTGPRTFMIPVPTEILTDAVDQDGKLTGGSTPLNVFDQTVIIPYQPGAAVKVNRLLKSNSGRVNQTSLSFTTPNLNTPLKINGVTSNLKLKSAANTINSDYTVETIFDGNPAQTDPSKTLDIVFLASEFSTGEYQLFRDFTDQQTDALIGFKKYPGKDPFPLNKSMIKVRRVLINQDFSQTPPSVVSHYLTYLGIPFDQIALVRNAEGRSNASLGGGTMTLFRTWGEPERSLLFAHELGHAFGSILDEYMDWSEVTSYDNNTSELYYFNRNCKEDPADPWVNNLSQTSFLICQYGMNLYRSTPESLMSTIYESINFNPISQHLFNKAFSAYLSNGISLDYPEKLLISYNTNDQYKDNYGYFYLNNLGTAAISYSLTLSPSIPGIDFLPQAGTLEPGPNGQPYYTYINLDYNKIPLGKNQLTMSLSAHNIQGYSYTASIPITIVYSNTQETPTLKINLPTNGNVINLNGSLAIPVSSTINPPGWRRIEYYRRTPDQQDDPEPQAFATFSSRTIAPYSATFTANPNYDNYPGTPGLYEIWARGVTFFNKKIISPSVFVDVKDTSNTPCNYRMYNGATYTCSSTRTAARCFLGSPSCGSQYCCPPTQITPSLTPTLTPTPKPGDADGDGIVDKQDYLKWLDKYGLSINGISHEDFDKNGSIDGRDYLIWMNNYGM